MKSIFGFIGRKSAAMAGIVEGIAIAQPTTAKKSSQDKLIEEIHESFFTEVDKLLAMAKVSLSSETQKEKLLTKARTLESLGFGNTSVVTDANKERKRLQEVADENRRRARLVNAINYFSNKYPQYKFITHDSVMKICEKYGLVLGTAAGYIGDIPDENVQHMLNFRIYDQDRLYIGPSSRWKEDRGEVLVYDYLHPDNYAAYKDSYGNPSKPAMLRIAAPPKLFNMADMKVVNKCLVVKDPVVLQPVVYNNNMYYLIVTAWGKEASDAEVMNPKMN